MPTLQEQIGRALQRKRVADSSGRPRLKPKIGTVKETDGEDTRLVHWITPLRYRKRVVHIQIRLPTRPRPLCSTETPSAASIPPPAIQPLETRQRRARSFDPINGNLSPPP